DDAQSGNQLAAEIGAAPPIIPERGECRDHRVIPHHLAEIALDPPQSDDKPRLDIVAPPDPVEQRAVLGQVPARIVHAVWSDDLFEISAERQLPFRLFAVEFDDVLQELGAAQRPLYRRRPDPLGGGVAADSGEKRIEVAFEGGPRTFRQTRRGEQRNREDDPTADTRRRHYRDSLMLHSSCRLLPRAG